MAPDYTLQSGDFESTIAERIYLAVVFLPKRIPYVHEPRRTPR